MNLCPWRKMKPAQNVRLESERALLSHAVEIFPIYDPTWDKGITDAWVSGWVILWERVVDFLEREHKEFPK